MNLEQDNSVKKILTKIEKASQIQDWAECVNNLQKLPIWKTQKSFAQLSEANQQKILKFAVEALINGDFQNKWDIAKLFSVTGNNTVEILYSLLKTKTLDNQTQWFIANILGNFKTQLAVVTLVYLLENCSEPGIFAACAKSLTQIGQPAIATLVTLLEKPNFRLTATKSLANIRLVATVPALVDLATDTNSEIRKLAIEALGSFREERVFPILVRALKDYESSIRKEAVLALGFWSHLSTELDLVAHLQPMLQDLNLEVCRQAAVSLSRLKNKTAIEALNQALTASNTDLTLKLDLVQALAWSENNQALIYLREAFWRETNLIQRTIITALGRINIRELKPQAISILTEFWNLSSSNQIDMESRQALAMAFGDLKAKSAREILEKLLQDSEKIVQLHASASIKKIDLLN